MQRLAAKIGVGKFGLNCAASAYNLYSGGNFWGQTVSFVSFFRHVAKLEIDYSKWRHYEDLAVHSSCRYMHQDFCIICDRPRILKVNSRNQPHCEDGPFCAWSDSSALFALNGVRVPAHIVLTPADKLDPKLILTKKNVEVRREIVRKIGIRRIVLGLGAKTIDKKTIMGLPYELLGVNLGGVESRILKMKNPSVEKTWHLEFVLKSCESCETALAWRNGLKNWEEPMVLT